MSEFQGKTSEFINQLVVKAIEKKKKNEEVLANKSKPRFEHVLFSQFDVLEKIESKNTKTTLYRLSKKGEPEKQVCCKVLNENQPEYAKELFLSEATSLEVAQHPSIIEFIKVGNEFERPYFMYKWANGESIAEKVARHKNKNFRHDHIAWLIYQLAGALEYIHTKGLCHLDIKPSNIIICEDDSIKLIDFGAANSINSFTTYKEVSSSYSSPLFVESGRADTQDDVYSMAKLACYLFLSDIDNDNWKEITKQKTRPLNIPKSIWDLLNIVINNPRSHGFTPISFAQSLANIDPLAMENSHNAPLFTQLKNADLVLRRSEKTSKKFTLLESLLSLTTLCLTMALFISYSPFTHENTDDEQSITVKPIQNNDMVRTEPEIIIQSEPSILLIDKFPRNKLWESRVSGNIINAFNLTIRQPYDKYQQQEVQKKISSQLKQSMDMSALHDDIISIKNNLKDKKELTSDLSRDFEKVLINLSLINKAYGKYTYSPALNIRNSAQRIAWGEHEEIEQELKELYVINDAENYFYENILPEEIVKELINLSDINMRNHNYNDAISAIDKGINIYGERVDLTTKKQQIIINKSEYVLFKTVTEESVFSANEVEMALEELHEVNLSRFNEVTRLLQYISREAINTNNSNVQLDGALLIESAINKYQENEDI